MRARSSEIAAVLLDMTMPGLSGADTFRELRRLRSDLPVLLSSGYDEREAAAAFTGKGEAMFIQKPYGLDDLSGKIRQLVRGPGKQS